LTDVPQIVSPAQGTQRTSKLRARSVSLDDIPAHLHYVPTADGNVQLAWDLVVRVPGGEHWYDTSVSAADGKQLFTADWTDDAADYDASFNVFPFPKRSPDEGARQSVSNPWDLAASPFGWQDLNGTSGGDSSVTNGNNVDAHDDLDNNNTGGTRASGGALNANGTGSLNFNSPVDFTQQPVSSLNAAITNLYYWNNLLHDIHFKYGFTEPAGNFQKFNYTATGAANDPVQADAQDGGGVNNANFSTPPDGSSGRMQMYVWNMVSPSRDGDFDASVMIHEYGHGVSNRLTGGPANSGALNATQSGGMGEGWSDFWALMLTQTDGSVAARDAAYPVAPYAVGEPTTGLGLRRFAYSFDMSIDPMTVGLFYTSYEPHHTG
jgi:extracellular elastinolytic metalloproteinase